jgi:oxygen-dependent protoporphyrinogen oxidase
MKPVVIIGGGITGLAAAWELHQHAVPYLLLEASERLGGKIKTERADGFIIEGAADSFLATKPWAWQLCREIGLGDRLIGTNDPNRKVYVLKDGRLNSMPPGMRLLVPVDPDGLLASNLLSEAGKRRLLAEPEIPGGWTGLDESLASFVRRRFGEEALEVLGEPLMAGIHTADPEILSMQASYPDYLEKERLYGNVTLPTRQTAIKPPPPLPGQPPTVFVSLKNGVYEMIEGLAAKLGDPIRLNSPVERLDPGKTVHLASGETIEAEAVILTVPTAQAARLTRSIAPELAANLAEIPTLSSATVSFGYREADLPGPLAGFGFVVAASEPTHLLASTWSSTKLPGRAPAGHALLRVFFGGHRHEADVNLSDEALVALAKAEVRQVMQIEAAPVISRIFRWRQANPQYKTGHLARLEEMENRQTPPWLRLAGSPYRGIGIPDCINQGRTAARSLLGIE